MIPSPIDPLHEFATARSLPLALMRYLTRSGTLTIVGSLALELAKALERPANVFTPPCALTGLNTSPCRLLTDTGEQADECAPLETDILIVTDRGWAHELLFDNKAMRAAAIGIRRMMILPFEFVPTTTIEVVDWSGFSPAGADANAAWRWCQSEDGTAQISLFNRLSQSKDLFFSFEINTHDGINRPVLVNGERISCGTRSLININLDPGVNHISLQVEEKSDRSIINGIPYHFSLMSPEIIDRSNEVLIPRREFILSPDQSPLFLADRLCREKLHSAGFRYVGGFHRSVRGGEARLDTVTAASIFDPSPTALDLEISYSPSVTRTSEIAWRIGSHRIADLEMRQ